jgi:Tfp pilus assembly protein PilX
VKLHQRDQRGAALLLAIAFMVVVGLIGGGVITLLTSASTSRVALDNARNREYAADGGIEAAISQVRVNMTSGQALNPCSSPTNSTLNGVSVQVTCVYAPTLTLSRYLQRNVIFTAVCAMPYTSTCTNGAVIIRAQVNYESPSFVTDPSITVSRTFIQSWSVNT